MQYIRYRCMVAEARTSVLLHVLVISHDIIFPCQHSTYGQAEVDCNNDSK